MYVGLPDVGGAASSSSDERGLVTRGMTQHLGDARVYIVILGLHALISSVLKAICFMN